MTPRRFIRRSLGMVGVAGALLVGGCDQMPTARVINNVGTPIVLVGDAGAVTERRIELAAGQSKVVTAYGSGRHFGVEAGGCRHIYRFPTMGVNFPFHPDPGSYPVAVQIEPDLAVYLAPSLAKKAAPAASLEALQAHGFPLRPVHKDCA